MKELLAIAIPITLGAAGLQIINLFDTMIYMRRLTGALAWSDTAADTAKGIYNYCQTIFALPCSLITPITISVIPAITAALTAKDRKMARRTEESSIRLMGLITMPCAAGMFALGGPIYQLLSVSGLKTGELTTAAPIMTYLGIAVIFNSTVLLFNAIMQAHGDVTTPVINMIIGGIVKVAVNYILVGIPALNIVGASIGTVICYLTITVLDVLAMVIGLDNNKINLSIKRTLPVPPKQPYNRSGRPAYDRAQDGASSRSQSSHSSGYSSRPASFQPAQPQPKSFDDMLKQFMTESDSKMSSIKEYSEHRTKTRRR